MCWLHWQWIQLWKWRSVCVFGDAVAEIGDEINVPSDGHQSIGGGCCTTDGNEQRDSSVRHRAHQLAAVLRATDTGVGIDEDELCALILLTVRMVHCALGSS